MASVIAELSDVRGTEAPDRRVEATAYATWRPNAQLWSALRAVKLGITLLLGLNAPDVLHLHLSERGSFLREGLLLAVIGRVRRIPVAATLHGATFQTTIEDARSLYLATLRRCNLIFCLGPQTQRTVQSLLPDASTRLIMNPVGKIDATVGGKGKHANLPARCGMRILFAGELGERKGFDRLLSSLPILLEEDATAHVTACGPIAPGFTLPPGRFDYEGTLPRSAVTELISNCAVACLPSRAEVLPMFVLEALAQGVPVVATDCGELSVLRDCPGFHLIPNLDDPSSLADAILTAYRSASPRESAEAKDWIKRNASAEAVVAQLSGAYQELMLGKTGR